MSKPSSPVGQAPPLAPWLLLVAVVLASAAAVAWLARDRAAAREVADRLAEDTGRLSQELGTAKRLRSADSASLSRLERENDELIAMKERLALDVAAREEEIERLKGTYDQLQEKMKKEIKSGDIEMSQVGDRLRVGLVDKILFNSGEAVISDAGRELLRRVGAILATVEGRQIQVSGHTDNTPPGDKIRDQFPTNWELSVARATNVVRFLEEEGGVKGRSLVASGYGEHHPIATNNTPRGRAKNRRIEILLVPLLEAVKVEDRRNE